MSRAPSHSLPQPYLISLEPEAAAYSGNDPVTSTWPAANRALYIPLLLPSTQRITTVSVWCTIIGAGTFDLGLFDGQLTSRLASLGSTALVVGLNTWTLTTPFMVEADTRYYLGMSASSASSSVIRENYAVNVMRYSGAAQEATAHPLPSTPTIAVIATAFCPLFALEFV